MVVSSLKEYIKEKKSVSMTQILLDLDVTPEEIEGPLKLLIDKKYILVEKLATGDTSKDKCKSCPMECSQNIMDNCGPGSNSITVYSWNKY